MRVAGATRELARGVNSEQAITTSETSHFGNHAGDAGPELGGGGGGGGEAEQLADSAQGVSQALHEGLAQGNRAACANVNELPTGLGLRSRLMLVTKFRREQDPRSNRRRAGHAKCGDTAHT